jgi:energy-coupling factor transporter ATP-binding protein EcfA2
MRYISFHIRNYKGIQDTSVSLGGAARVPITTLIGLNESGKTTLLEAINSFTYGREDISHLEIYGYKPPDPYDLVPIAKRGNFNGAVSLTATIDLDNADHDALAAHMAQQKWLLREVSRRFTVSDVLTFVNSRHESKSKSRTWSIEVNGKPLGHSTRNKPLHGTDPLWQSAVAFLGERMPQIWYFPNFLFDFPTKVYLEDNPDLVGPKADRNTFFRGLIQAALHEVEPKATIADHLVARAKSKDSSDKKSLASICLMLSRHLTATVFNAWSQTINSEHRIRNLKFVVDSDEQDRPYATLQIEDSDGIFEVSDRSLGFRWFFVFLLITQYVVASGTKNKDTLLLLDEPASNLHSTAQQRLLQRFAALSSSVTLMYATHSHHLIDPKRLESAYVIRNRGLVIGDEELNFKNASTKIEAIPYRQFVANHSDQTAYFQPALDVLEFRPSKLERIPDLAMVEGKADYYLLSLLLHAIEKGESPYSLYPGGGAGSLDNAIGLYIAWARPFVVLLDSDAEGRDQRARYVERYSAAISWRLHCLSDVAPVPAKASLEAILTSEDRDRLSEAAFGKVQPLTKKQVLIASQTCLVEERLPHFSAQAIECISRIDAKFREVLAGKPKV